MSHHGPSARIRTLLSFLLVLALLLGSTGMNPGSSVQAYPLVPVTFTILHTNDFHGQLEQYGSNPGAAKLSGVVNAVRNVAGADNVLLADVGDSMQGSLLSNVEKGLPVIAVFNAMGYVATALGNHDFDWGQATLAARISEATFPFLSANIVTGDPAGWAPAPGVTPYVIKTVGAAPNQVNVAFIGVTTQETADINVNATIGLTFKDPADSIAHYYDEMKAQADVIVVLSHLGFNDGGYGYGFPVYGDKTLASMLNNSGKHVDLILGGHSHTNLGTAASVGGTIVSQAYYNGRNLGRADITVGTDGSVSASWSSINVGSEPVPSDPTIASLVTSFVNDPTYMALINQPIGWTDVPITRDYDDDSLMGAFIDDAVYHELNNDAPTVNDVDMVFSNAGMFRSDITGGAYPRLITFGDMFTVLPFGNQIVVGDMTGADIMKLLEHSASLEKGALQVSGIRYEFYRYEDALPGDQPFAHGALNARILDKADGTYKPLDPAKTYRIGTNEFLAPSGGDGFAAFRNMKNITYWGDVLDMVNKWVSTECTSSSPYDGVLDGRIAWDGVDAGVPVGRTTVPLDALAGFTQETNAANLQADSVVFKLKSEDIDVDFCLAGAASNRITAIGATPSIPYVLSVRDMLGLMPYDNPLVVLSMNGPQIKAILERAFRNYYYYKYVPGYGGFDYYTAGMLDISSGCRISYRDRYPAAYDAGQNYVLSLKLGDREVNFNDPATYYNVATTKFLALGGVNFNNAGDSLWPLGQMSETTYYARDAVMDFIRAAGTVSPAIEGRLKFFDTILPVVSIGFPLANAALQDGVTLAASASDESGIGAVSFHVRKPGGSQGVVISPAYENMQAVKNGVTGKWELGFNTLGLPDGNYVVLAKAVDAYDNEGWSTAVPFTIRNWAVVSLLPSNVTCKAGKTMPVKFSIRVAASVDPSRPFVYNDDLTIRILDAGNLGTPLQISTFGNKSTDYRISDGVLYITNFQTLKTPKSYLVEIWRTNTNFMIGSFAFKTTK